MKIEYQQAKNNITTCSIAGRFLHSKYDPKREAQRFVAELSLQENITQLIVLEPCLSYIAPFLKEKFPSVKLIAIHFCEEFIKFSKPFFDISLPYNHSTFFNDFYPIFNEENLQKSEIITWIGSEIIFSDELKKITQDIKNHISTCKDILATRFFFAPKWRNNSIKFFMSINKYISSFNTTKPIIIAASGPSLKSSLAILQKNRDRFFLIAVSSAILPLVEKKIIPDLCLSTDGGYWAEKHLEILQQYAIPLAITPESAINSLLLKNSTIFPLTYGDQLEIEFYHHLGIKPFFAERNGTVTGTAVKLALQLTHEKVAICGLDMSEPKGFPHIQPNALEKDKENHDYKLAPKELRLYNPTSNASLAIYKNWFQGAAMQQFENRVFRIHNYQDTIMPIQNFQECTLEDFFTRISKNGTTHFTSNQQNTKNFYSKLCTIYDNLTKSSIISKEIGNYFAYQSYFLYDKNKTEENFNKVYREILQYLEKILQNYHE